MGINIKKVELKKDGEALLIDGLRTDPHKSGLLVDKQGGVVTHQKPSDDLAQAFVSLIPHLLLKCDFVKPDEDMNDEWFNNYAFLSDPRFVGVNVTGVKVSGKENDIVVLMGYKQIDTKEKVKFETPPIWLNDTLDKRYKFLAILKTAYSKFIDEVTKYDGGKYAATQQSSLAL